MTPWKPVDSGGESGEVDKCQYYLQHLTSGRLIELQTKYVHITVTEKAHSRAFFWLKVFTSAFTLKTLSRHYAKQVLANGKER